jgi:general secretion pathway protein M
MTGRIAAAIRRGLAARTPRERVLLAALAVLAAAWAVWAGAVQPLHAKAAAFEARLQRHMLALPRLAALPPAAAAPAADPRSLPVIVADTAAEAGLDLRRLQERDRTVSVQIDAAPADAVLLWIETLEQRGGLRLMAVTLTRLDAPGTVSATLDITR